jgi:alpha-D-ribose 1-methylphosphonate 5-triphosphate diphosphatase PhnM
LIFHTFHKTGFLRKKIETKYIEYYRGKYGFSAQEMENFVKMRRDLQQKYAEKNRKSITKLTQEKNISLAYLEPY